MFGKKSVEKSFTNLISRGTYVTGNIKFSGVIRIEGTVSGDVIVEADDENNRISGSVLICGGAEVYSDSVHAHDISIGGEGVAIVKSKNIWAENNLEILCGAEISNATIYYRNIRVEPGARLHACVLKHLDHCSEGEQV
jgi:cytoskeletal protein CcmA (bactofilin family)